MMLSVINLPGTKADCSGEIISGRICLSLLAITLDAILYSTLHKLIGLNYLRRVGFFTFGMRTKVVLLMEAADSVPSTILRTTLVTSPLAGVGGALSPLVG